MMKTNRGLTQYKITMKGEGASYSNLPIKMHVLDSMLDEKLAVRMREIFIKNINAGLARSSSEVAMIASQYILDNYNIFKNLSLKDARKMVGKMMQIMNAEERKTLHSYEIQSHEKFIQILDEFIDRINGTMIEGQGTLIIEFLAHQRVVRNMKKLSLELPTLEIMVEYINPNGLKEEVCFINGVVHNPELIKRPITVSKRSTIEIKKEDKGE